jgi:hypothetical protein
MRQMVHAEGHLIKLNIKRDTLYQFSERAARMTVLASFFFAGPFHTLALLA